MSEDAPKYAGKCQCRICVRGAVAMMIAHADDTPLMARDQIRYLLSALEHAEMDRDVAESRLDGSWPGWEWMPKEIKRREKRG